MSPPVGDYIYKYLYWYYVRLHLGLTSNYYQGATLCKEVQIEMRLEQDCEVQNSASANEKEGRSLLHHLFGPVCRLRELNFFWWQIEHDYCMGLHTREELIIIKLVLR